MKRQPIKSIGQLCPQKNVCITRNIFCFIMQKAARNTVNNKHSYNGHSITITLFDIIPL